MFQSSAVCCDDRAADASTATAGSRLVGLLGVGIASDFWVS
jgi:hypothetical protein